MVFGSEGWMNEDHGEINEDEEDGGGHLLNSKVRLFIERKKRSESVDNNQSQGSGEERPIKPETVGMMN